MSNHDELDDRIRSALDVEPSPAQLARLERFWAQRSRAESRRRGLRWAALAATLLVAAAGLVWQLRPGPAGPVPDADRITDVAPQPNRPERPPRALATDARRERESLSAGRAPTAYERLVFAAHRREVAVARPTVPAATLDELIARLAREPNADAKQLIASTGVAPHSVERMLLRRLGRSSHDEKHAVVRLLAGCGSTKSIPALLRLGQRDAFREDVVTAIDGIVGPERLPAIVAQTTDRRMRSALIHRVLAAGSEQALRRFLSLVTNDATRSDALLVAAELERPPIEELLDLLEHDDQVVRLSAAMVLGRVNGPVVTRALVERVMQNPSGAAEAWIALVACRGDLADEFLTFASREPRLLGHVNGARVRWALIVN